MQRNLYKLKESIMAKKQSKAAAAPAEKVSKKAAGTDVDAAAGKKGAKEAKEPKVATKFKLTTKEVKFKTGGQVELIVNALKKKGEATIDEITKEIEGKLQTKQSAKSVVSFYMTSMKKAGTVEAVKAA